MSMTKTERMLITKDFGKNSNLGGLSNHHVEDLIGVSVSLKGSKVSQTGGCVLLYVVVLGDIITHDKIPYPYYLKYALLSILSE